MSNGLNRLDRRRVHAPARTRPLERRDLEPPPVLAAPACPAPTASGVSRLGGRQRSRLALEDIVGGGGPAETWPASRSGDTAAPGAAPFPTSRSGDTATPAYVPFPSSRSGDDVEPPPPPPPPAPPAAPSGKALVVGNSRRPRTIASFIKVMQQRGVPLPFDPATIPKEVLSKKVPAGHSAVIGPDGALIGMCKTEKVIADRDLGVGEHRDLKSRRKFNHETWSLGGDVEVGDGKHEVGTTFLKSPIMLDLDGDGRLGTTGVSTARDRIDTHVGRTVAFDIDGDGDLDDVEWMDGLGDGMLVDNRDGGVAAAAAGDGRIDGTRLFGDQGGRYANGYEKLAGHDRDGDGELTGAELAGLEVWVDDGDARVEAGELRSLEELGITRIGARMHLERNERGEALMRSSFERHGEQHVTEDVWFRST